MVSDRTSTAIIIGGAGAMGRWTVRAIAQLGSVSTLLVADIDEARAKRIVEDVGGPCRALALDATDVEAMRAAFAEGDVVLNTMGPFSRFARPILETAIEAGCDYLDIDDDWESTLEAFELDAGARAKGVRVVKGIGGSPGYSNMCAVKAARGLDTVEEIVTGWSLKGAVTDDEPGYATSAAVEHWLIQASGTVRTWREGREQDVKPLERITLDYPGLGRVHGYTIGHPEAITLPRYIDGVQRSTNVTSGPEWIFDHVRKVAADYDAGRVSLAEGAAQIDNPPVPTERAPRDPLSACWAVAYGIGDGARTVVSVTPTVLPRGRMGGGTGVPLAIGLELLVQGRVKSEGVNAPEGAIDPDDFFEVLGRFVTLPDGVDSVVAVEQLTDPSPVTIG